MSLEIYLTMLLRGRSLVSRSSLIFQASKRRKFLSTQFGSRKPPILSSSSSDFAVLAEQGMFVDKSNALRDFLRYHSPIHLILRPRRSGKTILLSMFRDFFECASPDERARRKDLFIKNNLCITKDPMFEEEFGNYPVLYVDFSNLTGLTMAELLQNFRTHVTDTALQLEDSGFFQNRGELPKNRLEFLEAILNKTISDSQLPNVLFMLTEILHMLHQKRVIVLIDEYDTPTSYAIRDGYFPQSNNFFRRVFSKLLKTYSRRLARRYFVCGQVRLALRTQHLDVPSDYSTACMFTEDETRALYDRQLEVQEIPFEFDDLNKWYNGYSTETGIKLFNPWSISNALTTGKLPTWWNKSGYDTTIQARITELLGSDYEFRAQCQTLLNGDEINICIEDMDYAPVPNMTREQLWTLMYYAGYLTTSDISSDTSASVYIPNAEIHSAFRGWIYEDFCRRMTPALSETSIGQFNLLVDGHFAEFAESFGNFIFKDAPACLFGGRESAYREYVYAYFSSAAQALKIRPKWTFKMTIGAGLGRADIMIHKEVGVIVEVERFSHDKKEGYHDQERNQLSRGTKAALSQCDTRHYTMPEHVNTVYEYGLAFLGPYCAVEARVLTKVNGTWVVGRVYKAKEDEKRRQRTYYTDGLMSDSSTASKKGHDGPRKQDSLMVPADAITGRNLYARFYLETHAPTVAEFADIWKNLDREIAETWKAKARQMKRLPKEEKERSRKQSAD